MPAAVNEVLYNTSISLNRVFVFEFVNWVRFGDPPKDPVQKGVFRILRFLRDRTVPKSNQSTYPLVEFLRHAEPLFNEVIRMRCLSL